MYHIYKCFSVNFFSIVQISSTMLRPNCDSTVYSSNQAIIKLPNIYKHNTSNHLNTKQKHNTSNAFADNYDEMQSIDHIHDITHTSFNEILPSFHTPNEMTYYDNSVQECPCRNNNWNETIQPYPYNNDCYICNTNTNINYEININISDNQKSTSLNRNKEETLSKTSTIESLLYTLKQGITNAETALIIAKMVSKIIEKQKDETDFQQIVKRLIHENIVNILSNAMMQYSKYPQIRIKCQKALNQLIQSVVIHKNTPSDCLAEKNKNKQRKSKSMKLGGFKCNECGKIYKHYCNLKSHLKIHTDFCYICDWCGKRFGRKANHIEHLRVHTGEAPFHCKICHKRYKQRHGLKNHMKVHNDNK
eukprot:146035_1